LSKCDLVSSVAELLKKILEGVENAAHDRHQIPLLLPLKSLLREVAEVIADSLVFRLQCHLVGSLPGRGEVVGDNALLLVVPVQQKLYKSPDVDQVRLQQGVCKGLVRPCPTGPFHDPDGAVHKFGQLVDHPVGVSAQVC
jgi:hypothetical protein